MQIQDTCKCRRRVTHALEKRIRNKCRKCNRPFNSVTSQNVDNGDSQNVYHVPLRKHNPDKSLHEYLKNRPLPPLPLSSASNVPSADEKNTDVNENRSDAIFQTPIACVRRRLDFDSPPPPGEIRRHSGIMGDNHHANPNIRFKPPKYSGAKNDSVKYFFAAFEHFVNFNNVPQDDLILYLYKCV